MADKTPKPEKTPMQKATDKIKTAYCAAFFSAVVTFIFAVSSLFTDFVDFIDIFSIADVALLFILAVLLVTIKSRIAAVILLVYYLLAQVSMLINGSHLGSPNTAMIVLFTYAYYQGIVGTFAYHKLRKEEKSKDNPYN